MFLETPQPLPERDFFAFAIAENQVTCRMLDDLHDQVRQHLKSVWFGPR